MILIIFHQKFTNEFLSSKMYNAAACGSHFQFVVLAHIQAGRYTGYSSDDQRIKSIEGQVTEASTSCSDLVSSAAPNQYNPNQIFQIGNGFGFFLIFLSQRHNTPDLAGKFSVLKGGTLLESLRTSIQRNCHFLIYKHKAVFSFGNMVYLAQ